MVCACLCMSEGVREYLCVCVCVCVYLCACVFVPLRVLYEGQYFAVIGIYFGKWHYFVLHYYVIHCPEFIVICCILSCCVALYSILMTLQFFAPKFRFSIPCNEW